MSLAFIKCPVLSLFFIIVPCVFCDAQRLSNTIAVILDEDSTYQTMQNFAASDTWSCQFAGNWPQQKKELMADWLFSMDTLPNGNPKGIGLSMWRYNLGAGTAEQNDSSHIRDEWRRAALTLGNDKKTEAQNWFLKAAKQRGVSQFLGFFNSPPVQFTKNKKGFAEKGICNIDSLHYTDFAAYAVSAVKYVKQITGISFDYVSPVNEPQWDWSDGGQEGCPYNNREIAGIIKSFSQAFQHSHLTAKLLVTESGHLKYLMPANDKSGKDNQVYDFFNPSSSMYVGNLPNVTLAIASHSYFTTSPFQDAVALRTALRNSISQIKDLDFWQSEYCILGDNAGEIDGNKKDLGMNAALYLAKVIYEDVAVANASAWQWWTAISAYDYKDGLIYIDKNKTDGHVSDSKMLWALGNYSRFIRPGMKRIEASMPGVKDVYLSAYRDEKTNRIICVFVNNSDNTQVFSLQGMNGKRAPAKASLFITDANNNLTKKETTQTRIAIPAESVSTVVIN